MREIAGIRIPDSKLAAAALDLVKIESHASIYKHVLRTFVFGGLAARAEGIGFDEELFFLGAVLHDLGLTERFGAPAGRFEVVGADAAEKFLLGEGVAAERSAVVWEAIALHTSNGIALRRAPEVALVHIGASIDQGNRVSSCVTKGPNSESVMILLIREGGSRRWGRDTQRPRMRPIRLLIF